MEEVTFYFDTLCPWAYQTSRWMREVRDRRGLQVHWKFFSLEERNREAGKKHPWERPWSYGWSLLRVAALIRREAGNEAAGDFYARLGASIHERSAIIRSASDLERVMGEEGMEPSLVSAAIGDATTNDEVLRDHQEALDLGAFGVPTLLLGGRDVLFGPVIVPAPEGAAAERLWDLVEAWTEFPHLYEMQRPKGPSDAEHIQEWFAPFAMAPGRQGSDGDS